MSQSRFSIVLVGVSALLRRPLVSRLRPADGERSSWVVFTARGCRFDSGFRWAVGLRAHCFRFSACADSGCPRRVGLRVHRFRFSARTASEIAAGRVGLRAHCFRFSARTASEWLLGEFVLPPSASEIALGELAFGFTASAFRHAPLWSCPRRVGLRAHGFRFSACTASGLPSAGWFFRSAGWPSGSLLPLFGMYRFGVAAGRVGSSAFRFGVAAGRVGSSAQRVGLRAHCFRFSVRTASGLPSAGWFFHSSGWFFRLPLRKLPSAGWPSGLLLRRLPFGGLAFGLTASEIPLGGLVFGLTASAFRHAPLRSGRRAGWPSGSLLPLFGTHRFGDCRSAG